VAEWKPYQLASAGEIAALAEGASALAEKMQKANSYQNTWKKRF